MVLECSLRVLPVQLLVGDQEDDIKCYSSLYSSNAVNILIFLLKALLCGERIIQDGEVSRSLSPKAQTQAHTSGTIP